MTVTITIDIDDPDPVIPKRAVASIVYGDQSRRIEWRLPGSTPHARYAVHDLYQRRTFNELSYSDSECIAYRSLPESHPLGAPGYFPDSRPLANVIATHLETILGICLAEDMRARA